MNVGRLAKARGRLVAQGLSVKLWQPALLPRVRDEELFAFLLTQVLANSNDTALQSCIIMQETLICPRLDGAYSQRP